MSLKTADAFLNQERYEHVECRKSEGAHYTPSELSLFVADQIIGKSPKKKEFIVADPAIGDGELVFSILSRIASNTSIVVYGFDTNNDSLLICKKRIEDNFPNVELNLIHGDFLEYCLQEDPENQKLKFDLIIGNPPFIRTQVLGSEQAQYLAEKFNLKGRVDIYQAFLIALQSVMHQDTISGIIVSNRFLTTKGSETLRDQLLNLYEIFHVWDFGDTKLFEAAVLPAVLLFKLKSIDNNEINTLFTSVYETDIEASNNLPICSITEAVNNRTAVVKCENNKSYLIQKGKLSFDQKPSDVWRLETTESKEWLRHVENQTWALFGDVGKIRVGIKTTADDVFIKKDWLNETGNEPELLKPLITHHIAGNFRASSPPIKMVIYTHEIKDGKKTAVRLSDFPLSEKYLNTHKTQLDGRKYVKNAKRNWYEIWVPQDPNLIQSNKIVFRDISEKPTFWFDDTRSIVNGDCYWLTVENDQMPENILWLLLAVANSDFIIKFYDMKFNNKLYSNKRRFITQYVNKFPIPNPESDIAQQMIVLAQNIFSEEEHCKIELLQTQINALVWDAFDLRD